ncbi:O-antigen polysaccharide polymerase Wzy [Phycisphaeraceae bacterium D3-23]
MNQLQGQPNALAGLLFVTERLSRRSWPYAAWVLLFIPAAMLCRYLTGPGMEALGPFHVVYYTLAITHIGHRMFKAGLKALVAPDVLFTVVYTVVNWGYLTFLWLGAVPFSSRVIYFSTAMGDSLMVVTVGLAAFLIAYEVAGHSKRATPAYATEIAIPKPGWGFVGISLMCLGIMLHFIGLLGLGVDTVFKHGYDAVQHVSRYTDSYIIQTIMAISIPISVIGTMLCFGYGVIRERKLFYSRFFMVVWAGWVLVLLLEGDRGGVVRILLPAMIIYHYVIKPIKFRYLAMIGVTVLFIFSALAFVRNTSGFSPSAMIKDYQHVQSKDDNVKWYSMLYELGTSFVTLNITVHEVPGAENYWKGQSWLDSAIHVVPFAQGYAYRNGFGKVQPSDWVTVTYWGPKSSGKGYNFAAEGYLNFGLPGVIIQMFAIGLVLRWLVRRFQRAPSTGSLIVMFGGVVLIIISIRDHTNVLLPQLAHLWVVSWFMTQTFGEAKAFVPIQQEDYPPQ